MNFCHLHMRKFFDHYLLILLNKKYYNHWSCLSMVGSTCNDYQGRYPSPTTWAERDGDKAENSMQTLLSRSSTLILLSCLNFEKVRSFKKNALQTFGQVTSLLASETEFKDILMMMKCLQTSLASGFFRLDRMITFSQFKTMTYSISVHNTKTNDVSK